MFNGKTHYFYGHFLNSYVKLPEGNIVLLCITIVYYCIMSIINTVLSTEKKNRLFQRFNPHFAVVLSQPVGEITPMNHADQLGPYTNYKVTRKVQTENIKSSTSLQSHSSFKRCIVFCLVKYTCCCSSSKASLVLKLALFLVVTNCHWFCWQQIHIQIGYATSLKSPIWIGLVRVCDAPGNFLHSVAELVCLNRPLCCWLNRYTMVNHVKPAPLGWLNQHFLFLFLGCLLLVSLPDHWLAHHAKALLSWFPRSSVCCWGIGWRTAPSAAHSVRDCGKHDRSTKARRSIEEMVDLSIKHRFRHLYWGIEWVHNIFPT